MIAAMSPFVIVVLLFVILASVVVFLHAISRPTPPLYVAVGCFCVIGIVWLGMQLL